MCPEPPPSRAGLLVLGVDPGTRVTGWGIVALSDGEPRAVAWDTIAPDLHLPIEQRLAAIFTELQSVIGRYQPGAVAIEEPFVGENVRSAMAVGAARTVAMLAATLAELPVHHYPPASIKQVVAGYGRGAKTQVREMLRLQLGMAVAPDDLNASDALAVALCHTVAHRASVLLAGGSES